MDMEEKLAPENVQDSEEVKSTTEETVTEQPVTDQPAATQAAVQAAPRPTKFCSHCGGSIDAQAVVCPLCGCQVEQMAAATPNIVINNANTNTNTNTQVQKQTVAPVVVAARPKNKWVAILLCLFLGYLGGHKFYEGKIVMGVVYLFTMGLFFIGVIIDLIALLLKPNPYYV